MPLAPDTCLAYLVRHGATDSNLAVPPILQGRGVNYGLSAAGKRQAEKTAELFRGESLDAVYCSTLLRAQETARTIAQPHGLPVATLAELVEVDVGRWEGMSWEAIQLAHAEEYRLFRESPATHGYWGGENLQQVHDRVRPAVERILAAHLGSRILVVGHSVVNRSILAPLLGLSLDAGARLRQDNCSVNVLRFREGRIKLLTFNAVMHLGEDVDGD